MSASPTNVTIELGEELDRLDELLAIGFWARNPESRLTVTVRRSGSAYAVNAFLIACGVDDGAVVYTEGKGEGEPLNELEAAVLSQWPSPQNVRMIQMANVAQLLTANHAPGASLIVTGDLANIIAALAGGTAWLDGWGELFVCEPDQPAPPDVWEALGRGREQTSFVPRELAERDGGLRHTDFKNRKDQSPVVASLLALLDGLKEQLRAAPDTGRPRMGLVGNNMLAVVASVLLARPEVGSFLWRTRLPDYESVVGGLDSPGETPQPTPVAGAFKLCERLDRMAYLDTFWSALGDGDGGPWGGPR